MRVNVKPLVTLSSQNVSPHKNVKNMKCVNSFYFIFYFHWIKSFQLHTSRIFGMWLLQSIMDNIDFVAQRVYLKKTLLVTLRSQKCHFDKSLRFFYPMLTVSKLFNNFRTNYSCEVVFYVIFVHYCMFYTVGRTSI